MPNIFELGTALQKVFEEIEENDGELTPELEAELDITSQNFKDKIEAYCQVLTMYNSDIECCKNEKDRINSIQKTKKNNVERIKQRLLEAVEEFGEIGKKGNKVIETPVRKLFTKELTSVEENEIRRNKLVYHFLNFIGELSRQGILELGEDIDVNGLLASINANAKAEYELPDEFGNTPVEEFVPYTIADLQAIKLNITESVSLYNMITRDSVVGNLIASDEIHPIGSELDKDIAKAILNDALLSEEASPLTVGSFVRKTSLTIK